MLSREAFETMAAAIKLAGDPPFPDKDHAPTRLATRREIAALFVAHAQQSNPRFDAVRFLRACGLHD